MEPKQQILDILGKAKRVLIALPQNLNPDCVASALAFSLFLKKMDKETEILSSGVLPENLKFLPNAGRIKSSLPNVSALVLDLDTSHKELDELSYQSQENKVSIFLKSKTAVFEPTDINFSYDKFPVDVIITLDCRSLEDLGKIFDDNADLFYQTPKINIDNQADNVYFGEVNLVDATTTSVAEILATLFENFESNLLDEDIATCLLAGIITKTNSFQHAKTTPKAFLKASELVSAGGRQQEIIKYLFKTKTLSHLKLWGRVLARLKQRDDISLVYSLLSLIDFQRAEAEEKDLDEALGELAENISGFNIVGIVAERPEKTVKILLAVFPAVDADKLLTALAVPGKITQPPAKLYKVLEVDLKETSPEEAETKLAEAIKVL